MKVEFLFFAVDELMRVGDVEDVHSEQDFVRGTLPPFEGRQSRSHVQSQVHHQRGQGVNHGGRAQHQEDNRQATREPAA